MTTIAFKDGVLAADTQATRGDHRCGIVNKIAKNEHGLLAAFAGDLSTGQRFLDWFLLDMDAEVPEIDEESDCYVFYPDGNIVEYSETGCVTIREEIFAFGSGGQFARGAMACGKTAAESVAIAMMFDVYTGGKIQTLTF